MKKIDKLGMFENTPVICVKSERSVAMMYVREWEGG